MRRGGPIHPLDPRQRGTIRDHAYWQVIGGFVASGQRLNAFCVVWIAWAVETSWQDVSAYVCALHRCEILIDMAARVPRWRGGGRGVEWHE